MDRPDTFDRVDNMLVQCGSFASIIQIVCSVICIICCCGFGIFFFKKKDTRIKTTATVLHGECRTYSVRNGNSTKMQTDCVLDIEYKVGEEMRQQKIITTDRIHSKGEIIQIKYDYINNNYLSTIFSIYSMLNSVKIAAFLFLIIRGYLTLYFYPLKYQYFLFF
jgi:hypothetical protein